MIITTHDIELAAKKIKGVVARTPLQFSKRLSKQYNALIYLKREDLQDVRSFKIRGAYNKIASLSKDEKRKGVVCASAGNHAQGVAYSCALQKIHGTIFMPTTAPKQKIAKVAYFGGKFVDIELVGKTFDEASNVSKDFCIKHHSTYVHPFDDPLVIAGQGTVGKEIYEDLEGNVDVIIAGIGGGGLISGIGSYIKEKNPNALIIGSEPAGAASMHTSIKFNKISRLSSIDTFVDGAAVGLVGNHTFAVCKRLLKKICVIDEGKVSDTMIDLYQHDGIVAEPAGALGVAALDKVKNEITNKTVVCIISGGNNDLFRYPEIIKRSFSYRESLS